MIETAVVIAILVVWTGAHWKRKSKQTYVRIVTRGRK